MRDKKRIDIMCEKLMEIWKKQPDMRLGQLICNISNTNIPLFYVEDDMMLEMMEKFSDRVDEYFSKLIDESDPLQELKENSEKEEDEDG